MTVSTDKSSGGLSLKLATIHPFSVVEARPAAEKPKPKSKVQGVTESAPDSVKQEGGHDRILNIIEEAQRRSKKRQALAGPKRKGVLNRYTKVLFQLESQQDRGLKLDKKV
jgi:hypothetical protein